jgi:hypothetical protein
MPPMAALKSVHMTPKEVLLKTKHLRIKSETDDTHWSEKQFALSMKRQESVYLKTLGRYSSNSATILKRRNIAIDDIEAKSA